MKRIVIALAILAAFTDPALADPGRIVASTHTYFEVDKRFYETKKARDQALAGCFVWATNQEGRFGGFGWPTSLKAELLMVVELHDHGDGLPGLSVHCKAGWMAPPRTAP